MFYAILKACHVAIELELARTNGKVHNDYSLALNQGKKIIEKLMQFN